MARRKPNFLTRLRAAARALRTTVDKLDRRIDKLARRYVQARSDITAIVAEAMLSGQLSKVKRRREYLSRVKSITDTLDQVGIRDANEIIEEAFQAGVEAAEKTLAEKPNSRVNERALAALRDQMKHKLQDATLRIGRQVDDLFRMEGLRASAQQLADEKTLPMARRRFVRDLQRRGVSAFVDASGKVWQLDVYAEMVIRTTTSAAVFHGTQMTMLSRDFDLVEVNSVPDPCPKCKPYDGNTYSLTGRSEKYPRLDIVFPIHPNCRHYITPSPEAPVERRERREREEAAA